MSVNDDGLLDKVNILNPIDFSSGISSEWLIGNGIGGYASSTVIGANTRAYHGLLVAAMQPPVDRWVLLSSLDETVMVDDSEMGLANHQYPGTVHPTGYNYLTRFCQDPLPTFFYRAGDVSLQKTIGMVPGENTTIVEYRVVGDCVVRIVPLVTCRGFHVAYKRPDLRSGMVQSGVEIKSAHDFWLGSDVASFYPDETWYYDFEYDMERRRGLSWVEDCLSPGRFEMDVKGSAVFHIMASTTRASSNGVADLMAHEIARLNQLSEDAKARLGGLGYHLALAADSFIVKRGDGRSIIAGYHWFDDWGRDSMIAIPGLLLSTGRFAEAKEVLRTFSSAMKDGIIPNDLGALSYNTVDASLWFINAVYRYYVYSKDLDFVSEMWPVMEEIIRTYSGESSVCTMDEDCLITSREGMTWMDARINGNPVTPRAGKCCEINALWFEAHCIMEDLSKTLRKPWDLELSSRIKRSYAKFWNPELGCLYDVIDPVDSSIRPNQIIAAASEHNLLSRDKRRAVLDVVTRELLTPYGLRTLSPSDPCYIGRYEGGPEERDRAYHQGTVWPWLIGPYVTAYTKSYRGSKASRARCGEMLMGLLRQNRGGLMTVCEVYDGDAPHNPGGCISQAWSVGEVLRCWHEDVKGSNADGEK